MSNLKKFTTIAAAVAFATAASANDNLFVDPSLSPEVASELFDFIAPTADQEAAQGVQTPASPAPTKADPRQYLETFNIGDYDALTANVSNKSIAGTWVAVWDIDKERSNIKSAPLVSPRLISSRLEMVVVRAKGEGYEVANCHGEGFEAAKLNNGKLTTASRSLNVLSNRGMAYNDVVSKKVNLTPMYGMDYERSYEEKATYKVHYIKVSDATGPIGSFTQNWNTSTESVSKDVYCGMIDNLNDGLKRIRLGSDDGMQFVTSQSIDPEVPTALISEPTFKGEGKGHINTDIELCEASFYFDTQETGKQVFNYYVVDMGKGTMVDGTGTLDITAAISAK